jgi:hypothetical protein
MEVLGGRGTRLALLASLLAGLVIALLTAHLAGPWQGGQQAARQALDAGDEAGLQPVRLVGGAEGGGRAAQIGMFCTP